MWSLIRRRSVINHHLVYDKEPVTFFYLLLQRSRQLTYFNMFGKDTKKEADKTDDESPVPKSDYKTPTGDAKTDLVDPVLQAEKDTNFIKTVDGKKVYRFYPDRPESKVHKERFIAKAPSKYYDPCALSAKMAVKCMEQHDTDYKEACSEYFHAYRECKKEWMKRRREGTW